MKTFIFGTATAAYQIEGGATEDGRTPSIWDTFSHTPGKVLGGDTGDVACDHYHRSADDVRLMAKIGVGAYRFSTSWPRVRPGGTGPLNQRGVDFYRRLLDDLQAQGIEPFLTLNHWDLPQELEDAGGWPARDTAYRFAEYASMLHDALGDRVRFWTTHNEPWCAAFLGYGSGEHAPGRQDGAAALAAAHHLNLGHGLAAQALTGGSNSGPRGLASRKDSSSSWPRAAEIGISLNLHEFLPASESAGDLDAVRRLDAVGNRIWLEPIFRGSYPSDLLDDTAGLTDWSFVQDGDLEIINQPIDFMGLNYYTRSVVAAGEQKVLPSAWPGSEHVRWLKRDVPVTDMGWEIDPEGLAGMIRRVHEQYGPIPLYVTENGAAYPESLDDQDRIAYIEAHIRVCERAVEDGVPLKGYFVWSLMDNFEWAWGYSKRFGIVHVDYESQARTPKASAHWYSDVIRKGGLGDK